MNRLAHPQSVPAGALEDLLAPVADVSLQKHLEDVRAALHDCHGILDDILSSPTADGIAGASMGCTGITRELDEGIHSLRDRLMGVRARLGAL